jgi:hypothetical protein
MTDPEDLLRQATGEQATDDHDVTVPFDRYEITIRLGPRDEFKGILSVGVRTSFLSHKQKLKSRGQHDVADLYED